jgi:hypothetical protein
MRRRGGRGLTVPTPTNKRVGRRAVLAVVVVAAVAVIFGGSLALSRSGSRSGNCDPSYPDVCIPSPPPYLHCRDIPYRNFRVLPPDPHGFDGNHNGIGCEG